MKLIFLLAHATLFFRGVDATEGNLRNNPNNDADNMIQTIKQELMQVQSLKQELMQEIQNLESSSLGLGVLETLEMESKELKADNIVLKEDIAKLEDKLKGLHEQVDDIKHEADLQKDKVDHLDYLYTHLKHDVDDIDKDVQILNTGWWDAAIVKVNVEDGDTTKLGICHGDCDSNDECAANLVCNKRDINDPLPTGCLGLTYSKFDFCGRAEHNLVLQDHLVLLEPVINE